MNSKIYYSFPEIKKIKFNKVKNDKKIFKFSGELTDYRYAFFKDLNKIFLQLNNKFKKSYKFFFDKIKNKEDEFINIDSRYKYKFSFHPKKMDDWKFSSPTRYIRAISNLNSFDYFKFYSDNLTISLRSMPKSKMTDLIKNDSQQLVKLRKGIKIQPFLEKIK